MAVYCVHVLDDSRHTHTQLTHTSNRWENNKGKCRKKTESNLFKTHNETYENFWAEIYKTRNILTNWLELQMKKCTIVHIRALFLALSLSFFLSCVSSRRLLIRFSWKCFVLFLCTQFDGWCWFRSDSTFGACICLGWRQPIWMPWLCRSCTHAKK